jgi:hypothetical protein
MEVRQALRFRIDALFPHLNERQRRLGAKMGTNPDEIPDNGIGDDDDGHRFGFFIPAGSFEIERDPAEQLFIFDSAQGNVPDIKAKFNLLEATFQLNVKDVWGAGDIVGTALAVGACAVVQLVPSPFCGASASTYTMDCAPAEPHTRIVAASETDEQRILPRCGTRDPSRTALTFTDRNLADFFQMAGARTNNDP